MMDFITSLLSSLGELAMSAGMKIIYAILLLIIGIKLTKFLCSKFEKSKAFSSMEISVAKFLLSANRIALYSIIFISCAMILGVPAATFVTVLGSAGLAVGLAMQGSLSNLAGSIMILLFKPFKVGDYIEVSGLSGVVDEINIFYGKTRRRLKVPFDDEIHERLISVVSEMHRLYERRYTPKVKRSKQCNACSLKEICLPKLSKSDNVQSYIKKNLEGIFDEV